ncbi:MAG: hypothetical protein ACK4H7_00590 [Acidilobaceae archaeon]
MRSLSKLKLQLHPLNSGSFSGFKPPIYNSGREARALRSTMAWVKCELCGRRGQTFECLIGKSKMSLCIYCAIAVSTTPRVACKTFLGESLKTGSTPAHGPGESLLGETYRKSPPDTGKRGKPSKKH